MREVRTVMGQHDVRTRWQPDMQEEVRSNVFRTVWKVVLGVASPRHIHSLVGADAVETGVLHDTSHDSLVGPRLPTPQASVPYDGSLLTLCSGPMHVLSLSASEP